MLYFSKRRIVIKLPVIFETNCSCFMIVILISSCANHNSLLSTELVTTDRKGRPWLKTNGGGGGGEGGGVSAKQNFSSRFRSPLLLPALNFIMFGAF